MSTTFQHKSLILFLVIFAIHVWNPAPAPAAEMRVFRLSDRKIISYEQMAQDLKKASLVFVGETHDVELHHKLQLDIIKTLHDMKIPLSVGFEMFTSESQPDLDRWTAGLLPEDDFISIYYKNWNFPWSMYRDIFRYLRDNKIPAIGLNVPPEITQKVARQGFSSLSREELEKLPEETGCVVNEAYMEFIRRAYAMHGHGGKRFLYFCEAQLLWDQVMAENLLKYIKQNPRRTVVVLTGNGHAWKRGITEQIRTYSKKTSFRVVLPDVPGSIDPSKITVEDADYILLE